MVDGSDLGDPLNCITEEATLEIYKVISLAISIAKIGNLHRVKELL